MLLATHRGLPIDLGAYRAPPLGDGVLDARYRFLLVPGYTPYVGWRGGLHPEAVVRLTLGLEALRSRLASTIIVSGAAVHSPDNEAVLMHAWLVEHGVHPGQIVLEPYARHTTTNLRNAGRIVLAAGESAALVVTSDGSGIGRIRTQAFYLGRPTLSTFHARCLLELGHVVGELTWLRKHQILFRPSARCLG